MKRQCGLWRGCLKVNHQAARLPFPTISGSPPYNLSSLSVGSPSFSSLLPFNVSLTRASNPHMHSPSLPPSFSTSTASHSPSPIRLPNNATTHPSSSATKRHKVARQGSPSHSSLSCPFRPLSPSHHLPSTCSPLCFSSLQFPHLPTQAPHHIIFALRLSPKRLLGLLKRVSNSHSCHIHQVPCLHSFIHSTLHKSPHPHCFINHIHINSHSVW